MKLKEKLLEEYLREQEKKHSNRMIGAISSFRFWGSEYKPFIEEVMLWAYKKGLNQDKPTCSLI